MKTLHKPIEWQEFSALDTVYAFCDKLRVGSISLSSNSFYDLQKKWYIDTTLPLEMDMKEKYDEKEKAVQAFENAFNAFLYKVII